MCREIVTCLYHFFRYEASKKSHIAADPSEDLLCHAKLRTYGHFSAELYLNLKQVSLS